MTDLQPILDRVRTFAEQSGHTDLLANAVPIAIMCLVVGIGLSVLGAKLARPGATLALGALGAAVGVWFSRTAQFADPAGGLIGAAVGAVVFAMIAHRAFPMLVGVATAVVFSSVALGTFGGQRVLPHYAEFTELNVPAVPEPVGFAIPSPEQQEEYLNKSPREFAGEFWAFVNEKDATVASNSRLLGVGAGVMGLFLGLVAVRWMLILSTSLVGTALLTTGVGTILKTVCSAESFLAMQSHSAAVGMGVGAFLVTSLVLQTLLTRKAPTDKETGKAKA
ncbi:MAG: hypothetical protein ACYTFA_00690 [Planctomycetota bacterium]|jgi:hypothetical protein